ncbi:MAG: hypothetical protein MRY21_04565 [Simkaniaceae bacterium]|nr:hypothetical protein [Simkaniaceae bacterium]
MEIGGTPNTTPSEPTNFDMGNYDQLKTLLNFKPYGINTYANYFGDLGKGPFPNPEEIPAMEAFAKLPTPKLEPKNQQDMSNIFATSAFNTLKYTASAYTTLSNLVTQGTLTADQGQKVLGFLLAGLHGGSVQAEDPSFVKGFHPTGMNGFLNYMNSMGPDLQPNPSEGYGSFYVGSMSTDDLTKGGLATPTDANFLDVEKTFQVAANGVLHQDDYGSGGLEYNYSGPAMMGLSSLSAVKALYSDFGDDLGGNTQVKSLVTDFYMMATSAFNTIAPFAQLPSNS